MTQLVLNIENSSALRALKALVKNMVGVHIAPKTQKRKTGLDFAMEDVEAGRITEYASVAELIKAAKQ